jgi:hypothetical protein
MIPQYSFRTDISTSVSDNFLHQGMYNIYESRDGTCFNMYYYNDKWIISTVNGYEMNNVKWNNNSYQDIITECLCKLSTSLTWEQFTDGLNKSKCYGFGFKHPDFHPFNESKEKSHDMWFIQSVDLDENSSSYLKSSQESPFDQIQIQKIFNQSVTSLKELYKIAYNAINDYSINGKICYGFILKSVNCKITTNNSNLFIESSLIKRIRKFWYENTVIDLCKENGWNKKTGVSFNAYLDNNLHETFL